MRRNTAAVHRRLDRLESAAATTMHTILLDDGRRVFTQQGDAIRLLMEFIRADADSYETGEPPARIEHPHIALFARSVEQPGEGTISQHVRQLCRAYLAGGEAHIVSRSDESEPTDE